MARPSAARCFSQSEETPGRNALLSSFCSSSATVRIVHFVSPCLRPHLTPTVSEAFSGDPASSCPSSRSPSSPSASSCFSSPSCSLASHSEALLLSVGGFNILVDCPLDFQSLLLLPPQFFPQQGASCENRCPRSAPSACVFSSVCSSASSAPCSSSRECLPPVQQVSPESASRSSLSLVDPSRSALCPVSSPFLRALLPVRLDAVLLTHPHGALGLPLLAEFLDLSETPVLVTPPVLLAASSAARFLQSPLGGFLLPPQGNGERSRGEGGQSQHTGGGDTAGARERREAEAERRVTSRLNAATCSAVAAADEENSSSLQPLFQDDGGREQVREEEEDENDALSDAFSASRSKHEATASQFLGGVSRHVWPTTFNQERQLVHAASAQKLCVYPVSSGFCLGGANWVVATSAEQKIVVVGPSAFELQEAPGSGAGGTVSPKETVPDAPASSSSSGRNVDADASAPSSASPCSPSFVSLSSRYPLAADWRDLRNAALVVFFSCAPAELEEPSRRLSRACPPLLRSLSSSLDDLRKLVSDTVHERRGNVLIPLDLCGLSFLEVLETVASASSLASSLPSALATRPALLPAVPVYCVGPGLPALLQFAVEAAEWVEERRAERTRDMQSPRPPFFLSACEDEELLLSGRLFHRESAVGSRTRNLIVGEKLLDVMPLREPSILLLAHASLRVGEAPLLLQKWKKEETHLLVSVDRRFSASLCCESGAPRPSRTSGSAAASQVSSSSRASDALNLLLLPFLAPLEDDRSHLRSSQGAASCAEEERRRDEDSGSKEQTRHGFDSTTDARASRRKSPTGFPPGPSATPQGQDGSAASFAPSRGFSMRVASLPLDARLDGIKIAKLIAHFQPRAALLPAPVFASVNSHLSALHADEAARPPLERGLPSSLPSAARPSSSSSHFSASSFVSSASAPTHLASFEANRSQELPVECIFSPRDAALLACTFSLLLLDAEGAEGDSQAEASQSGDSRGGGAFGSLKRQRDLKREDEKPSVPGKTRESGGAFPRCFLVPVPVERDRQWVCGSEPQQAREGREEPRQEDATWEATDSRESSPLDSAQPVNRSAKPETERLSKGSLQEESETTRVSVGWIPPGSLLRGSGQDAEADRGLLTLILPPSTGDRNPTDAGEGGGGETTRNGHNLGYEKSSTNASQESLFFGTFPPEQLLLILHDRGFHDASLQFHDRPPEDENLFACLGQESTVVEASVPSAHADKKSLRGAESGETHKSRRLPVLSIPSLNSRVLCQNATLTEVEAPDAATRRFLRGLIGQILVEVEARET
ncbi:hypothetical protein TGME49_228710 [Toxoplasma gondii ME49]|uniref:Uncharacterized protein n=1 Tax=Toxoplasma gondii (strain ATCC 50611 / Me49) TaxID=508771 RepID=S8F1K5_TOXGM|nr:hypothetical protein TGME49_228710 [Toxoplasma gondii ME49]EPT27323.1 hypothetical protein TGME49_228710 [Toxoplasma gondii ME49]|eukprot:XP_018636109.1 hypothetical protein TGME49_228710 [Toxoplasma gondii ME49]